MRGPWQLILSLLEKTLNPGLFQVWIKPLDAVVADDALTLLAPNEFVAAWVRDRLAGDILQAAHQALGRRPELTVRVKPKLVAPGNRAADAAPAPAVVPANGAAPRPVGLPGLAGRPLAAQTWRFSFDDFVVGPCNELAFMAARGLCKGALASEQFYLCSSPGLGKTHLVHAIGRQLAQASNRSSLRVACLTAEEFTSSLVMSIKSAEMDRFRAKFRQNLDVLLLEDIHFLQGKAKVQDELLCTLKALHDRGCRVVFTSSFLPRELNNVDNSLASRFCSGLMASIDRPCLETRMRILQRKAAGYQVALPENVTELLAERLSSDIRQLESCLQNLALKARLLGAGIDLSLALDVLQNYAPAPSMAVTLDGIIEFACRSFGLTSAELSSKSRKRQVVMARNMSCYLARKHTSLSLEQIGSRFNRRHSTVLKAITNVEREIATDTPLGRQLSHTMERIGRL
ncbi:MAG: chromosomal replication initiator protein DnaA [Thermodesulfobacteriota bacterium]